MVNAQTVNAQTVNFNYGELSPDHALTHDPSPELANALVVQSVFLELRTLNNGLLLPWIAPAIRGLVLKPLRDHVCKEMGGRELIRAGLADWREQPTTSELFESEEKNRHYCAGCRKNISCSYGRLFEPDLNIIDPNLIQRGDSQGLRGISIASAMLAAEERDDTNSERKTDRSSKSIQNYQLQAPAGTSLSVRLLAIGQAIEFLPTVVQAIDGFGRLQGIGYQSPVHFMVDNSQTVTESRTISPESLAIETSGGLIPEVTIEFLSPLLIKNCLDRGRLIQPSFHDLFSNSVRIVIRAIREFANREYLLDAQFGDFFNASQEIQSNQQRLIPFQQPSISHRHGTASPQTATRQTASTRSGNLPNYSERPLRGWLGSLTFSNVPASYLPWLIHAGHLGIGSDRNRGAGLWRVMV